MSVELPAEHHLEFLSLKGDCTGLSESTLVEMPHCWKSQVTAHIIPTLISPIPISPTGMYIAAEFVDFGKSLWTSTCVDMGIKHVFLCINIC